MGKMGDQEQLIRRHMSSDKFSGKDPLAVLQFLKNFSSACNETRTSEGMALHLLKHFLASPARELFKVYHQVFLRGAEPGRDYI